jgi:hypothetical protein
VAETLKNFVAFVPKFVKHVQQNAESMKQSIAGNVPKLAHSVQRFAEVCQAVQPFLLQKVIWVARPLTRR